MAMFDGGLFVVLLAVGVAFLAIGKFGLPFKLISVFIFFGLGTVLLAGYDVGFVTSYQEVNQSTGAAVDLESTWYMKGDADASTFNDNATWGGWIFIALGMMTSFVFLARYIGGNY